MKPWQNYIVTHNWRGKPQIDLYCAKDLIHLLALLQNEKTRALAITPIPTKPRKKKH